MAYIYSEVNGYQFALYIISKNITTHILLLCHNKSTLDKPRRLCGYMLDSVDSPEFLRSAAGAVDPPLLLNGRSEIAHHIANLSTSRCKRVLEVVFNEVDRELCSTLGELVERGFTIKKMRFLRRSGNDSLINSCLQTILNSPKGPPSTEIVFCTDKRLTPSSSLVDVFQSVDLATVAKVVVNRKKRITTEPVYDCSGVLRDLMNANALRCLDLRSVEVSDVDASVLIAWAESPTCSLVELLMDNCSLTRCFIIPAIISRNTSLVSLGVSGNFLDDHQLRQLLASLSINGTLKSLDLSYNSLRNVSARLTDMNLSLIFYLISACISSAGVPTGAGGAGI